MPNVPPDPPLGHTRAIVLAYEADADDFPVGIDWRAALLVKQIDAYLALADDLDGQTHRMN